MAFYVRTLTLSLMLFAITPCYGATADLIVGEFSKANLQGWEEERFEGETEYSIQTIDGQQVLQASSRASASGLVKKMRIDLYQYPYLSWRWKIDSRLPPRDETRKDGDDYPVRIYIIVDGGIRFWRSKALNYVWTRGLTEGSSWPNAFADKNVVMLSLRDANAPVGTWLEEKRNVLQDIQRYLDPKIRYIDGIAIMTDTDNTHSFVNAYYGDIVFSGR